MDPAYNPIPTIEYIATCDECNAAQTFILPTAQLTRWRSGGLIQDCFPNLTEDERELLISHVCGKCFDAMFDEQSERQQIEADVTSQSGSSEEGDLQDFGPI